MMIPRMRLVPRIAMQLLYIREMGIIMTPIKGFFLAIH